MMCRAHELAAEGIAFPFEPDQTVITVRSSSNDRPKLENLGAFLSFDADLAWEASFLVPERCQGEVPIQGGICRRGNRSEAIKISHHMSVKHIQESICRYS
jgi:hypothetical protein